MQSDGVEVVVAGLADPPAADGIERSGTASDRVTFVGAGTITARQFIARVEQSARTEVKFFAVNRTLSRPAETVYPLMRGPVDMNDLLRDPIVLNDSALRAVRPDLGKTPYSVGIPATVAALRARRESVHV